MFIIKVCCNRGNDEGGHGLRQNIFRNYFLWYHGKIRFYLSCYLVCTRVARSYLAPVRILFYHLNNRGVVIYFQHDIASVGVGRGGGHAPRSLCFYFIRKNIMSPLCSIIKETPTYQKSKSGGMYHLARSRVSSCSFIKHPL